MMSATAQPVSASQFSQAIQDLPMENLYSKAHEIENSIAHLEASNRQLQEYSDGMRGGDEGDRDCLDAIRENHEVIARQRERVALLRQEVERRGGRWHGGGAEQAGEEQEVTTTQQQQQSGAAAVANGTATTAGGRLTDEQILQRTLDRVGDESGDEADGMHL